MNAKSETRISPTPASLSLQVGAPTVLMKTNLWYNWARIAVEHEREAVAAREELKRLWNMPGASQERTFQIWAGSGSATCFAADVDGRQYVVTAGHVVKGADLRDLRITRNGDREPFGATRCWLAPQADIAVISVDRLLAPSNLTLPLTKDAMVYSQDAYFLGFPYGLTWTPHQLLHQGQPIPLVKKAVVSGELELDPGHDVLLLDGHNNQGFSGGPVVLMPPGRSKFQVVGVVLGYRIEPVPVSDTNGLTIGNVYENTGLMLAENIAQAVVGARALGDGCPI